MKTNKKNSLGKTIENSESIVTPLVFYCTYGESNEEGEDSIPISKANTITNKLGQKTIYLFTNPHKNFPFNSYE